MPTGPAYDSGDRVGPLSQKPSGTTAIAVLFSFSLHCFAYRQRACTSNLDETGALVNDEAEEIEDERDDRDEVSETMDSGEDADETEFAKDDRRGKTYGCGDDVGYECHFSATKVAETLEACAIAKLIEDLQSMKEAALTAGVLKPML